MSLDLKIKKYVTTLFFDVPDEDYWMQISTSIENEIFCDRWQQSWRLSLKDILQQADMNEDFKWRR